MSNAEVDRLRAEVKRMRAEVQRLTESGRNWHRSALANAAQAQRAEAERDVLRARLEKVEERIAAWESPWAGRDTARFARSIRAALASVPEPSDSEPAPERRCSQCGQGISERACGPTHALLYAEQKKACEPAPDADREAGER